MVYEDIVCYMASHYFNLINILI